GGGEAAFDVRSGSGTGALVLGVASTCARAERITAHETTALPALQWPSETFERAAIDGPAPTRGRGHDSTPRRRERWGRRTRCEHRLRYYSVVEGCEPR